MDLDLQQTKSPVFVKICKKKSSRPVIVPCFCTVFHQHLNCAQTYSRRINFFRAESNFSAARILEQPPSGLPLPPHHSYLIFPIQLPPCRGQVFGPTPLAHRLLALVQDHAAPLPPPHAPTQPGDGRRPRPRGLRPSDCGRGRRGGAGLQGGQDQQ